MLFTQHVKVGKVWVCDTNHPEKSGLFFLLTLLHAPPCSLACAIHSIECPIASVLSDSTSHCSHAGCFHQRNSTRKKERTCTCTYTVSAEPPKPVRFLLAPIDSCPLSVSPTHLILCHYCIFCSPTQPKKNIELVNSIRTLLARVRTMLPVELHWCAGHVGVPGNERADQLANLGVEERLLACFLLLEGSTLAGSAEESVWR